MSEERWQGSVDADMRHIKEAIAELKHLLFVHTEHENRKLDSIYKEIGELKTFRARLMGQAAVIAVIFSAIMTLAGKLLAFPH